MSNAAEKPFVLLAQRYLEAAQAAKNPRFEDFTRAHQAEWAARQALVGDPVALAEAIVALAAQQQPTPEREALGKLASELLAEADDDVKAYRQSDPATLTYLLSAQVKRDAADRIRAALAGGEG